ncbi:MAG: DUF3147 family protein [Candidatus Delongbacteria bacterium]|nr:DUF3147 family protein [Candidatus Delongbacteria bacterium]MDD4205978.1 DUF3147 family protein [Candidatus Delongbacteria bacterium]MDY0018060.1 DUF3147 family protein [Candidatus Delongbacteria bacterium]
MYYAIKVVISAALIVLISEISKKSNIMAGILASVPLVSFIAIIWMFLETKDVQNIQEFSKSIFWLVLPSLSFFALFPVMLKYNINFWLSFIVSAAVMSGLYYLTTMLLKKFGA